MNLTQIIGSSEVQNELVEAFGRHQTADLAQKAGVREMLDALMSKLSKDHRLTAAIRRAADAAQIEYTPIVLGSAIAGIIKSQGFADRLFPGDNGFVARTVRGALKMAPALSTAVGDTASDVLRNWLKDLNDDASIPRQDRSGIFDGGRLFKCPKRPDIVFVADVDGEGNLLWLDEDNRIPSVMNHRDLWLNLYTTWRATGQPQTRQTGGPKNRSNVVVSHGELFCIPITTDEAIEILGKAGADPETLKAVQNLLAKPKAWDEALSDDCVEVLRLLIPSIRIHGISWILSEDKVQDIVKHLQEGTISANWANRILAPHLRKATVINGERCFTEAHTYDVIGSVDMFLGGSLQLQNAILDMLIRIHKAARGRGVDTSVIMAFVAPVLTGIGWGLWVHFLVNLFLFLKAGALTYQAISMDISKGVKYPLAGVPTDASFVSMTYLFVAFLMFFTVSVWGKPWQKLLDMIPGFKPDDPDWLNSVFRQAMIIICVFIGTEMLMSFFHYEQDWRLLMLAPAIYRLGVGYGLNAAEHRPKSQIAQMINRLDALRLKRAGDLVGLGVIAGGLISAHVVGATIGGLTLFGWATKVYEACTSDWMLMAVGLLVGAIVLAVSFSIVRHRFLDVRKHDRNGTVAVDRFKIPWWIPLAGLLAMILMVASVARGVDFFDNTVLVEKEKTVDMATGSTVSEKRVVKESGETFIRRESVTKRPAPGLKREQQPAKLDVCSDPKAPASAKVVAKCPGF